MIELGILSDLIIAMALAIGVERFLSFRIYRLREDRRRIDAALDALDAHKKALNFVLSHEAVGPNLKNFLLQISEDVTDHEFAQFFLQRFRSDDPPPNWDEDDYAFDEELKGLERRDPKAYQQLMTAFRTAVVASILQWPDTTKGITELMLKMAEYKPEVTKFRSNIRQRPRLDDCAAIAA